MHYARQEKVTEDTASQGREYGKPLWHGMACHGMAWHIMTWHNKVCKVTSHL